ncbi:MAG: hypothetical protein K8I82_19550 [Anaerolineae bacterium]|nr:hypothetical protein [Anaerolineae bacterium]
MNIVKTVIPIIVITVFGLIGYAVNTAFQPSTHQFVVTVPALTVAPLQPEVHYDALVEQVAPPSGTTIQVYWGDMGQQLIEAGAIDFEAFEELYGGFTEEQLQILQGDDLDHITFTHENIQFWTNVLWALGLTQEGKALSEGSMKRNEAEFPLGNYASTGGWTIGSKPAVELYSSVRLIELTAEQDDLVYSVAENVFRPCCGNHAAFPDCNHGMAVLGLLELLATQGATEQELYQAALAFNSYAFANTYITIAAYFAMQGTDWQAVDPQRVLGYEFSSGQGAQWVAAQVGQIQGIPGQGGSCSPS